MKEEAIRALELFKQQHLARPAVEATNGQTDIMSESPQIIPPFKESTMREPRNLDVSQLRYPVEVPTEVPHPPEPTRKKGVNFNYPDHYKPLKDRIMSSLNNGARTAEAVANYCKEEVKLINLQLGRWVSRGQIGRKVSPTGIIRFYPYEIAKEMGILEKPKKINYYTKERRAKDKAEAEAKKRSSSFVAPKSLQKWEEAKNPTQAEAFVLRGDVVGLSDKSNAKEAHYIGFLEKRIVEWQVECRKLAKQIADLENQVVQARAEAVKAKTEPRNVTGEVQEVMKEVLELRNTVAYLESKLFGRK